MSEQKIKTENDLANFIIGELRSDGWTCHEEVQPSRGGQIADIVAVKNSYIRVIETKMNISLALIEQAHHWTFYAHSVYVASYRFKEQRNGKLYGYNHKRGKWAFDYLCKNLGIGVLMVEEKKNPFGENTIQIDNQQSKFKRKILPDLKNYLCDETLAKGNAGTSGGKHWTPFKRTCDLLLKTVKQNPGIKLRDAIKQFDHHYSKDSTAVACLAKGIFNGFVKGIEYKDGHCYEAEIALKEKVK